MRLLRGAFVAAALLALAGLCGCSNDDVTNPSFDPSEVEAGAVAAALTAPTAEAAEEMILAMLAEIGGPAPLSLGAAAGDCSTFDLGNGITGTCSLSPEGVYTITFGGTVDIDGELATLEGTFVVTPAVVQPLSGVRYLIDFDATATSAKGSASWSAAGTVTFDTLGTVADYDFTMTHTITPTGGTTVMVSVVVSPTRFQLIVTGPLGNTLRFALNRETMTGTVSINSNEVASVTILDGCTTINFFSEELVDRTVCADDSAAPA